MDYLNRASLALRKVRPSPEEIARVQEDPGAVDEIVADYLHSPDFLEVMKDLHAEMLLLRTDSVPQLPAVGALAEWNRGEIYDRGTEMPLKLVEHVIGSGLPYTELVTADYALTDALNARLWGLPYDPEGPEWQLTRWPDGRPAAGLLSSGELWLRHESDGTNFHRGRANLIASAFLCTDLAARDVTVEGNVDIADAFAVADAVMTNPSCVGCHQSLDPLAAYLWGFRPTLRPNEVATAYQLGCGWDFEGSILPAFSQDNPPANYCYPVRQYTPANEGDWAYWDLRPPSFFGRAAHDLADVGELIAEDPRFSECIARRFYGYLSHLEPAEVPEPVADELQAVFVDSGFDARTLAAAVVAHPTFRTVGRDGAGPAERLRVLRPEQYARVVEDLTGYRWDVTLNPPGCADDPKLGDTCWGDVDLFASDLAGFRAMSGGIDGYYVVRPVHAVTPVKLLAMEQLAWDAAGFVVDRDLAEPDPERRRLLQLVGHDTLDEPAVRAQLAQLHVRVLGEPVDPDGPAVDASYALFTAALRRAADPTNAWKTTLGALLQDPRMLLY